MGSMGDWCWVGTVSERLTRNGLAMYQFHGQESSLCPSKLSAYSLK